MPIRTCKDCGFRVEKDIKTGKWWCVHCKEVKDDCNIRYKIVVMGKNTGKEGVGNNNFLKSIAREWRKLGHQVIAVRADEVVQCAQQFEMTDCFRFKKPINLRLIEYKYGPDFIIVEQMYNKYDISEVKCPVIYQHREYTHFPDIDNPDILLGSYPFRLQFFEQYRPYEYHKIKYRDHNFVAVDPVKFAPVDDKIIGGISVVGWAVQPEAITSANGIITTMVIEDQIGFLKECQNKGYISYMEGVFSHNEYQDLTGQMEATLIDAGYINGFGRRLFEAMAMKTMCVVRVHNAQHAAHYKKIGLTEEMCFFVYEPDDFLKVTYTEEQRLKKVEKAYEWMMENHTYEVRARQTLEKYEAWKRGETKMPYYMGYARRANFAMGNGMITIEPA